MQAFLLAVLICDVGGAGTPAQAQPVVDKFLKHLEKTGGWKDGQMSGAYRNREAACTEYFGQSAPVLVAVDLANYLERHKAWGLAPLAHMGGAKAKRYYLLVRKGSYRDLASLKGKTLVSPLAASPKFLYRVVLAHNAPPDHFTLRHARRPLKGLRQVARGKADATLVDEAAYAYLKELKLPSELEAIYTSKPMPGLTLAASRAGKKSKDLTRRVYAALPELCKGAGAELCKTFDVKAFAKAKASVYRQLQRQYAR